MTSTGNGRSRQPRPKPLQSSPTALGGLPIDLVLRFRAGIILRQETIERIGRRDVARHLATGQRTGRRRASGRSRLEDCVANREIQIEAP